MVANQSLAQAQEGQLRAAGFGIGGEKSSGLAFFVLGSAWISAATLQRIFAAGFALVLESAGGAVLGWMGAADREPMGAPRVKADPDCFDVRYPWDLLRVQEKLLSGIFESKIEGELSAGAELIDGALLHLGAGSRILPGVVIEGTAVIGRNCKIGPNCFIRGFTAIGDACHVGNAVEIKNSILMNRTSVGHLSYCGDSILGAGVNFGAGTITANFRHDGKTHRSMVNGELLDTGRRKFGAVVGDGVHTGIHTSIYPGRKLWPGVSTRPGSVVQRDLRSENP